MSKITVCKVVSRNFIMDIVAKFQNLVGLNLTSYEKMIQAGTKQVEDEIKNLDMVWYRYEISQLSNGAMAIMLYGESK